MQDKIEIVYERVVILHGTWDTMQKPLPPETQGFITNFKVTIDQQKASLDP